MEERLIQLFRQIVSEQAGLNIRDQDIDRFVNTISSRIRSLRLSSPDDYFDLLKSGKGRAEWQEIVKGITTGETYFFRDKGQFSLLRLAILPELIERNKAKKSLRIWSAGCSTGEEAYSIATIVDEINHPSPQSSPSEGRGGLRVPFPLAGEGQGGGDFKLTGWDIVILGTDINEGAIERAKTGHYGEWSFRQVGDEIRKRYFQKMKKEWLIDERIRGMVRFEVMNLITDTYPTVGAIHELPLHDIDLILCRNVFIYFKPEVASKVVEKMTATLGDGGYLMTGHAELRAQELPYLKTKVFPESVVYQKTAVSGQPSVVSERYLPEEVRRLELGVMSKPIPSPTLPLKGREFFPLHQGEGRGEGGVQSEIRTPHSAFEQARACADRGRHDDAARYCNEAIKVDPFKPAPYYLLAQIAREKGEIEREKEMLKRVIYLNPSHVAAYMELGIIYETEGDAARAMKMRTNALELLKKLKPAATVEPYEGMTAGELVKHVEKMVK